MTYLTEPTDLTEQLQAYSEKQLEQKGCWYGTVAEAYNAFRPQYPISLIHQVVSLAQLPQSADILELGCGPGTATVSFAQLGYKLLSLEPNKEMAAIARRNCAGYPTVQIRQIPFETWPLDPGRFDVVLAASSIHWIREEIRYTKTAAALRPQGCLILLWNFELLPSPEVKTGLIDLYERYAPTLIHRFSKADHDKSLQVFGQSILSSGLFENLQVGEVMGEVVYPIQDYLELLGTYSPYIALDPQQRQTLWVALSERLQELVGDRIPLTSQASFHVARVKP